MHARRFAVAVGAAVVTAACSGGTGSTATPTSALDEIAPTSTTLTAQLDGLDAIGGDGLNGVVLARALPRAEDLPGLEERSFARPYRADERPGLLVCGDDIRAESGILDGVQSVLVQGEVQLTVTVSAAPDANQANGFVERFAAAAGSCSSRWVQDAALLGAGPLEVEVLGVADVGAPGPPVRAFRLRTSTDAGSSDVVAAVFAVGPVITAVTTAGPVDADLSVATDAVAAAARRSVELVGQLG